MGDNEEDIGIYEEEKILENVHYLKSLKKLRRIQLYHLKINSDVKATCPNARVFIDQFLYRGGVYEIKVQKQDIYCFNIDTCCMYNQCVDRYVRTNVFRL